ncbi:MAG: hypothetical protein KVP17_000284 [Porospora cf. gigantea B]|uniref:uncharacterized protein n=1 Tax=Porospora cf. gigantea B TaxID=2853592 RepID=UPI0035719C7A|nr:MAG: hypothetical protein KVP17_000284 [Porospora cf. gigantea B]
MDDLHFDALYSPVEADPSQVDELTLQEIYHWLKDRIQKGLPISPFDESDPDLPYRFNYNFEKMSEYGDLVLMLDTFAGQESQWGARNWKLWLEWELDLFETYKEWEIPHLLWNNYVLKQEKKPVKNGAKAVEVTSAMSFVLAYCASLEAPWFVETFPDIGNQSLDNVEVCRTTKSTEALDVHMVPRLMLVCNLATEKSIYAMPRTCEELFAVWKQYDKDMYSHYSLRHCFLAVRHQRFFITFTD